METPSDTQILKPRFQKHTKAAHTVLSKGSNFTEISVRCERGEPGSMKASLETELGKCGNLTVFLEEVPESVALLQGRQTPGAASDSITC